MRAEITALTRLRHTALWELTVRLGTQGAAAEQIGVCKSTFCGWLTLKSCFPTKLDPSWSARRQVWWRLVKDNLESLTGQTIDELFPESLQAVVKTKAFCNKTIEQIVEIPEKVLLDYARAKADQLRLPSPDEAANKNELAEKIGDLLETLTPREHQIIELRYGLNGVRACTLTETARKIHVTRERIRQIEHVAVRKLQQPHRARHLAGFVD